MSKCEPSSETTLFGDVIYSYTRTQAIADGVLVDVSETAREAGFRWPVAMTDTAWQDCVAWSEVDNVAQTSQDESGRLWDVVTMAVHAIRARAGSDRPLSFQLFRVQRGGGSEAVMTTLKLQVGPGDDGEPVVTILLPSED